MRLGIIGYGNFGQFIAERMERFGQVQVYDAQKTVPEHMAAGLDDVCRADYLMLAIPLGAYQEVLQAIRPNIADKTIIFDIASVKLEPIRLIKKYLPGQPFVATHPLFGPQSAAISMRGQTIVLCESNVPDAELKNLERLCLAMGLNIEEMSADEHDRQMAVVQGLTFFISRTLNRYGLDKMTLSTPSFERLLQLADLDKAHTDELMDTIFRGNQYAYDVRREFITEIKALDKEMQGRRRQQSV